MYTNLLGIVFRIEDEPEVHGETDTLIGLGGHTVFDLGSLWLHAYVSEETIADGYSRATRGFVDSTAVRVTMRSLRGARQDGS